MALNENVFKRISRILPNQIAVTGASRPLLIAAEV